MRFTAIVCALFVAAASAAPVAPNQNTQNPGNHPVAGAKRPRPIQNQNLHCNASEKQACGKRLRPIDTQNQQATTGWLGEPLVESPVSVALAGARGSNSRSTVSPLICPLDGTK